MAESKAASLDFGTAIAFVAPGFIAFKALSYYSWTARSWLVAASEKEQGVGVFLFVLLSSIALGIGVSGVRAMLIDRLFHWKGLGNLSVAKPVIAWARVDESKRAALNTLIEGFYRYYQFYSNSFIALAFLAGARLSVGPAPHWGGWHWTFAALMGISMLWSSRDSYRKYCNGVIDLFNQGQDQGGTSDKRHRRQESAQEGLCQEVGKESCEEASQEGREEGPEEGGQEGPEEGGQEGPEEALATRN